MLKDKVYQIINKVDYLENKGINVDSLKKSQRAYRKQ